MVILPELLGNSYLFYINTNLKIKVKIKQKITTSCGDFLFGQLIFDK